MSESTVIESGCDEKRPSALHRLLASDFVYGFSRSPTAIASAVVFAAFVLIAAFAPWLAPQDPFDPAALDLANARIPPVWIEGGETRFPLGTDGQGRDLLSVLMYGPAHLVAGECLRDAVRAGSVGVTLGLVSGYAGGRLDALIMRLADMQLSFPAVLVALLIDGLSRTLLPHTVHEQLALFVVIFAIGYFDVGPVRAGRARRDARRKHKDYVHAARLIGMGPLRILFGTCCPTCSGRCWSSRRYRSDSRS